MIDHFSAVKSQVARQVSHWVTAAANLDLDDLASAEAWKRLERYLGLSLRKHLDGVIAKLRLEDDVLAVTTRAAESPTALRDLQQATSALPKEYRRQLLADTSAVLWALVTQKPDLSGWQPVHAWMSRELERLV